MKLARQWSVGLCTGLCCLGAAAGEFRALWVGTFNPYDSNRVATLIGDARAGRFNTLIPELRNMSGYCYFDSHVEAKSSAVSPSSYDPLADMIVRAHDTSAGPRIAIHPWIIIYPIWLNTPPPSSPTHTYNLHPEWLMKEDNGGILPGGYHRLDPGHPEVQQYLFNLCMDLIASYDIDGFNFDNIRYTGQTAGYNEVAVARFNSHFGRTGQPATTDPLWMQFRRDQVTALVRKVYLSAIALKPHLVISADTITGGAGITNDAAWPTSSAYNGVLQDWRGWMEEGILDLNIPMAYVDQATGAKVFRDWNLFAKNHRYNRHAAIGMGLYRNSISNIFVQCRITREGTPEGNHAEGLCGFSYNSNNNEGQPLSTLLSALTQPGPYDPIQPPVFAQEDVPPAMPWKTSPTLGHLKGFVFDDLTNCLDGAELVLSGPATRRMTNDATGFFGTADLPPGSYALMASFPAFASATQTVTIAAGAVTHQELVLEPNGITFVLQPQDRAVVAGSNVTLSARAAGVQPISYQWLFNGATIPGATGDDLTRAPVSVNDAGGYQVVASNQTGAITSLVATLFVPFGIQIALDGSGTVSRSPDQASYASGSRVYLTADPAAGQMFTGWSGDASGWFNPITVTVTNTMLITAHFAASACDLVVDNAEAGFTGSWVLSSLAAGRYGADYRWCSTVTGAPTATATYRPRILLAGNYDVYLWYAEGSNRATNAPWVISSSGGSVTSVVDQTTGGSNWLRIAAARRFEAGTNGFVRLQNNTGSSGKVVIADAVRLVWSRVQPPAPLCFAPAGMPPGAEPMVWPLLGNASQSWLIEYTTNFDAWLPLDTVWTRNPLQPWSDADARAHPRRFYRAQQTNVFRLTDFEGYAPGSTVLFRISGTTAQFVDPGTPSFVVVTNQFPAGNESSRVLQASWSCVPGTSGALPWLRLSTTEAPVLPNPTVSIQQAIGFAAWASRDLYLTAGLRETSTTAPIGADGGFGCGADEFCPIEWIGGITDNATYPPKGRLIPAGQWVWVEFCIPGEPVRAYSGDGFLDSTTGKAVFEELAVVPADGLGPYRLYLDDFQFIALVR